MIPTRDSAGWIGTLLGHYRERGFTPIILLDSRTTDGTAAIAKSFGCRIVDIAGFRFTEAVVAVTRDCVETPWALFMHDDEAPSAALFGRLDGPPPPETVQSVAIPRRWAWHEPGAALRYGVAPHWADRTGQPGMDHTWRLFRPDRVRFIARMHTEGFLVERWSRCPPECYIVHFEWVIRSFEQRQVKLRNYDRARYGYGSFFANVYLPEIQPPGQITFEAFETQDYDALAQTYWKARRPAPPMPPLTLRAQGQRLRNTVMRLLGISNLSREPRDRAGLLPRLDLEEPDPITAPAFADGGGETA